MQFIDAIVGIGAFVLGPIQKVLETRKEQKEKDRREKEQRERPKQSSSSESQPTEKQDTTLVLPKKSRGYLYRWISRYWLTIISFCAAFFIVILAVGYFTPVFLITSPRSIVGSAVVTSSGFQNITVEGRGAQPGQDIKVIVYDGNNYYTQTGKTKIDQSGHWSVDRVVLLEECYDYEVWAETQVNRTTIATENHPHIKRTSSSSIFTKIPWLGICTQ